MPHQAMNNAVKSVKNDASIITDRFALLRRLKKIEAEKHQPVAIVLANNGSATVSPLTNNLTSQANETLETPVDTPTLPQRVTAKAEKARPSGTTNAD
jgi:CheY-like chemotaxis protein